MTPVVTEDTMTSFFDPVKLALDTLENIIRRKLIQQPSGYMALVAMCTTQRFYLTTTDVLVDDTWNEIRKDPAFVDFLIDITRELSLRGNGFYPSSHDSVYSWLASLVSDGLVGFVSPQSSIDSDFLMQFNPGGIEAILMANPWLVVLNLAGMLPVVQSPVAVKELEATSDGEGR